MPTVISVENVSKCYRLGVISSGTVAADLHRTWARLRGLPDPTLQIGQTDYGNRQGELLWALRDVSFQVQQGEALGIIGRNGSGKSTILKILSRVTGPTAGAIRAMGRIASLLEVGTGFHPELTGRENIYLNGAIMGMNKREIARKFEEIVEFSEVGKFIDTPVKRYSSGMYVRLAFAVAAHLEPEILIVDEVLAVGDAAFQKKCLGKMSDVAGEGRTVLFVSHNMAAVQSLCKNSILLDHGNIVRTGDVSDVIAYYLEKGLASGDSLKREGKGVLTDGRTMNTGGEYTEFFRIGEPIRVLIRVDGGKTGIRTPQIGLGFNTSMGQRLCTLSTYFSDVNFPTIYGETDIICDIPAPNFAPGEYFVKIAISDSAVGNLIDVDNALKFQIIPSDYFGNGRIPNNKQGQVVMCSNWRILKDDAA